MIALRLFEGSNLTLALPWLYLFVFFCALTWVYVRRANSDFDARNAQIVADAMREDSMMQRPPFRLPAASAALSLLLPALAIAAPPGATQKQLLNWHAIGMFFVFVR